jgi:hypothetical protein
MEVLLKEERERVIEPEKIVKPWTYLSNTHNYVIISKL